jgi:hypothetical protein
MKAAVLVFKKGNSAIVINYWPVFILKTFPKFLKVLNMITFPSISYLSYILDILRDYEYYLLYYL